MREAYKTHSRGRKTEAKRPTGSPVLSNHCSVSLFTVLTKKLKPWARALWLLGSKDVQVSSARAKAGSLLIRRQAPCSNFPTCSLWGNSQQTCEVWISFSHFTVEKTKSCRRRKKLCPRSYSWLIAELGGNPRLFRVTGAGESGSERGPLNSRYTGLVCQRLVWVRGEIC